MLQRDKKFIVGDIGLDLAGGEGKNKRMFNVKKYICVDIDKKRLEKLALLDTSVKTVFSSIESLDTEKINGNAVLCIQTIGINNYFNTENTLKAVQVIIDATKKRGNAIFNIGGNSLIFQNQVVDMIKKEFQHVKIIPYGKKFFDKKRSKFLSFLLSCILFILPKRKGNKCYFLCINRI